MTYLPSHPFQPHSHAPSACGHPDGTDVCAQLADNPIHRVHDARVEQLAAALAAYPWQTITPEHWRRGRPCVHREDGMCGVCAGDMHAIATAVLDIQKATPVTGGDPLSA